MIDVNKITSTLAKLPDQQLQQYAQMHKNDPYTMALAMAESNRRKETRAAGQGAQGMQEQPKVVDQMVAEMAPQQMPEDQGIGQLPAGDMNFAGGGIIAFADGGDVERYQSGGNIFAQMDQQKAAQLAQLNSQLATIEPQLRAAAASGDQQAIQTYAQQAQAIRGQINAVREAAGNRIGLIESTSAPPAAPPARVAPAAPTGQFNRMAGAEQFGLPAAATAKSGAMPEPGYTRPGMLYDPRLNTPPTQPVVAAPAAPIADTGRRAGPPAAPLAAPLATPRAATGPTDIDALQQKYFGSIDQGTGELRNARAGLVAGIRDLTEKNLAATKADIEKRGDVYKGREERLAKQEKGLEGMGDKNMGLALLQAGAAMMSTPGGLGVALGKGVQIGSERYAAGLDKIEAAKAKFAEARDRLDDLRINRDDMNTRDIRAAEKEARESQLKGKELLYNGLVSDLGIKQKNVTAIFGAAADDLKTTRQLDSERANTLTREGGANARSAAQIAATLNTPDRLVFDKLLKDNKNDPVKALEAFKLAKGDKFDVRSSYADYLKAFAGKESLTPPMSMGAYAGQFGATLPR
jgi:hypothetical protein